MSAEARHGGGKKITKITKITMKTQLVFCVLFVAFVDVVPPPWRVSAQAQPPQQSGPTEAQQRPVFRGGTHFVRVDAYPLRDGKIVEGLAKDDFEVLEDGRPQQIDSIDFVRFDTFTPEAERRDPSTRREGFDMAADPRFRVFVIFVDMTFNRSAGAHQDQYDLPHIQRPLGQFLDRVLGPRDLYGFLTSRSAVNDLVLGRKSTVIQSQLADLFRSSIIDRDDADVLDGCGVVEAIKLRHRADATYTTLEGLVVQLGAIRQERKNVVFVSNLLPRWRPDAKLLELLGPTLPRAGITQGRVGVGDRSNRGANNESFCASEFQRLANMDFDQRFRMLLDTARRDNVSFYNITPAGLQATATVADANAVREATDSLVTLAHDTDGIAVVNTNDLGAGMKRIADDLAAYYVLGYYTTNTKFDGRVRDIKVRLKPSGQTIRARRQYRAPTQQEIAALAASAARGQGAGGATAGPSPVESALTLLERGSRPFAIYAAMSPEQITVVTELSFASIQAGRWKDGAEVQVDAVAADGAVTSRARGRIEPGAQAAMLPVPLGSGTPPARVIVRLNAPGAPPADDWLKLPATRGPLLADPIVYRSGSRIATRPVATFEFARNERIRVEWPVRGALDRREVRLLDRAGRPLPVELPLNEDADKKQLVVEMSLSGLGRGDFLIELTAGAGTVLDRRLLAIRLK